MLRLGAPLLLAVGLQTGGGCARRPVGVDFSVDRDFDFGALRRVAVVDAPEAGRPGHGLDRILVDAAAEALAERFVVVDGNRLLTAVRAGGVEEAFRDLRTQLGAGQDPDGALVSRIGKAIGVDAIYVTGLANLERRFEPDYAHATVLTSTTSGYTSISQTSRTSAVTTVRLTGRLYEAGAGLVVWSGSKYHESARSLEATGLKPVFRTVSEDFLLTMPASRTAQPPTPGLAPGATHIRTSR
ncbi:MAG: hypothetical protein FJZ01_06835 [Candidatus Sericytochromatia bacterium]|nr:hypothetical protein [Candidatus Tanganyikabacteria bacterium]